MSSIDDVNTSLKPGEGRTAPTHEIGRRTAGRWSQARSGLAHEDASASLTGFLLHCVSASREQGIVDRPAPDCYVPVPEISGLSTSPKGSSARRARPSILVGSRASRNAAIGPFGLAPKGFDPPVR